MFLNNHLLSTLIFLPIFGGLVLFITPSSQDKKKDKLFYMALAIAFLNLFLCTILYLNFDTDSKNIQFVELVRWFSLDASNNNTVYYYLGVDGLSAPFILLTNFVNLVVLIVARPTIKVYLKQYMSLFLIMTGLINAVFSAQDSILFYFFWEMLLIPTTLSIGIWGGKKKPYAAMRYFVYSFLSSIFLLFSILCVHQEILGLSKFTEFPNIDTFSIENFIFWANQTSNQEQTHINISNIHFVIIFALFLGFSIKIPIWPFHSWLTVLHSSAPSGGSIALITLMLKLGVYGLLRFLLPLSANLVEPMIWFLVILSLVAVIYAGLVAITQNNLKSLIAYSAVSHMGLVSLAIFFIPLFFKDTQSVSHLHGVADAQLAIQGALFQSIIHAFSFGGIFICCGFLSARIKSTNINNFQGIAHSMPIFSVFFMIFCLANIGLPGTSGFVGEFMIITAVFKYSIPIALITGLTLVITPAYILWMYKRIFLGEVTKNIQKKNFRDVHGLEFFILIILSIPTIGFGIYPEPVLKLSKAVLLNMIQSTYAVTVS